ncbi:hypothetical protein SAMN02990966_06924 [Rhodospirillales bacterium URHD0017]|nr:hypothetical protein SAMN02990966_06924 [Rhodospirillales bacterium URHD0017]
MGRKVTPTTGRPRSHALEPGFRPQLAFNITSELMSKIREAQASSGRSQSAEVEHRLERSFQREQLLDGVIALRYGPQLGALIETIADAAQLASLWGNALADREQGQVAGKRKEDPRIYAATLDAVRLVLRMFDPANEGPVVRPKPGPPTWDTLADIAAVAAYDRASLDSQRREAFKALGADASKVKRLRKGA